MLPCVIASDLKGLGEMVGLNAGTVHTRPCLNRCLLNQSHVQIYAEKKVILPFSRQINPKIKVNSPPAQEIPISHAMGDTVVSAFAVIWIVICAVTTSEYIFKFKGREMKPVIQVSLMGDFLWHLATCQAFTIFIYLLKILNHTYTFTAFLVEWQWKHLIF